MGEEHNEALTQVLTNTIWLEVAPFLASATSLTAEEIRSHSETTRLRERLRDITPFLNNIERTQRTVVLGVLLVPGLLYGVLPRSTC